MECLHLLKVEVAYANLTRQRVISLEVPAGCTVAQAIVQSKIFQHFPELELRKNKVGIFSKLVTEATVLQEGDRVEIYEPLLVDPKQTRRQRAVVQKKKGTLVR